MNADTLPPRRVRVPALYRGPDAAPAGVRPMLDPLGAAFKGPVSLLQSTDAAGWTCAALGACLAFIVGGDANVMLLVLAVTAAGMDVSSGTLRAILSPAETATARKFFRGGVAKLLRGHVVALGILLDLTLLYGIPGVADAVERYRPWTRFALLVLIGAEGTSVIRNLRLVMAVPRKLEQAYAALRGGDPAAALQPLAPAAPGEEPRP